MDGHVPTSRTERRSRFCTAENCFNYYLDSRSSGLSFVRSTTVVEHFVVSSSRYGVPFRPREWARALRRVGGAGGWDWAGAQLRKRTPSSAAYLSTRQRQDARWEWDCRLTGRDRRRIGNAAARVDPSIFRVGQKHFCYFFSNYTLHQRNSQYAHTHPYEYIHANPTHRSIFGDCVGKFSRLTKSPQASHCRRERRLPLKAQTSLNPEKFAPTRSRTQDLRCYRSSCNH
jgi:hypothetical protein